MSKAPESLTPILDDSALRNEVEQELESIGALLVEPHSPESTTADLETQLQQLQDEEAELNRQWLVERQARRAQQRSTLRKALAMAAFALLIIVLLKQTL